MAMSRKLGKTALAPAARELAVFMYLDSGFVPAGLLGGELRTSCWAATWPAQAPMR